MLADELFDFLFSEEDSFATTTPEIKEPEQDELYDFLFSEPVQPQIQDQITPLEPVQVQEPVFAEELPATTQVQTPYFPEEKPVEPYVPGKTITEQQRAIEEIEEKPVGTVEAMGRSFAAGAADLAINFARTPQTAAEVYVSLNNLTNRGVNKLVEIGTGGKVKEAFKEVPHEAIPNIIKLDKKAKDVKALREFSEKQKKIVNTVTDSKDVLSHIGNGDFGKAAQTLGTQVAAQIPLLLSMFAGGAAGVGAKGLGGLAGATEVSSKLDNYWQEVEKGTAKQDPNVAGLHALVSGAIEFAGETAVTGKIISDAVKNLAKGTSEDIAKKTAGNVVGQFVGKMMKVAGQEGTEETIVGYSQAVSDKIFGERDVTFLQAVKEGINSGLVGTFTGMGIGTVSAAAGTRRPRLKVVDETGKETLLPTEQELLQQEPVLPEVKPAEEIVPKEPEKVVEPAKEKPAEQELDEVLGLEEPVKKVKEPEKADVPSEQTVSEPVTEKPVLEKPEEKVEGAKSKEPDVVLYTGTPEPIERIKDTGLFGGIFATSDKGSAQSHGKIVQEIKLSSDEILTQRDIDYHIDYNKAIEILKSEKPTITKNDDIDRLWELVAEEKQPEESDVELLHTVDDIGEVGWEAQRLRGVLAKKLGYKAVETEDEHGVSYLVLPGADIVPVKAEKKEVKESDGVEKSKPEKPEIKKPEVVEPEVEEKKPGKIKEMSKEYDNIKDKISQLEEIKKTSVKETAIVEGQEVDVTPTEAQKEAGNYKKAHISRDGMDISIENPAGSTRTGVDETGKQWAQTMKSHYGYIKGTVGKDKDHLDVFIKPDSPEGGDVYVVNQVNPKTGDFDEHKLVMGVKTEQEAKETYLSNYEKGWKGFKSVVPMSMDKFKTWAYSDAPKKGELKPTEIKPELQTKKEKPETKYPTDKDVIKTKGITPEKEGVKDVSLEKPSLKEPAGELAKDVKRPEERKEVAKLPEPTSDRGRTDVRGLDEQRTDRPRGKGDSITSIHTPGKADRTTQSRSGERPRSSGTKRIDRTDDRNNYRISPDDQIGSGGLATKLSDNLNALRLLKKLDTENRRAIPEEQKVLARYVGWGGLKTAFKEGDKANKELKSLLTEDEYKKANRSILDAHYTSPDVINAMWNAVGKMGVKKGKVLEPSAGIGNFIGLRPEDNYSFTGIELDAITSKIAKQLYQGMDIRNLGFEDYKMPKDHYDLVMTNVPFGRRNPVESSTAKTPILKKGAHRIHNFFMLKSMYGVKPGGLGVFVTSRYSMDTSTKFRNEMAKIANFVGAIRLPKTAFKENANTEVVTDILVFQKRPAGTTANLLTKGFQETKPLYIEGKNRKGEDISQEISINNYFQKNPDHVIGKQSLAGTMYREGEYTVSYDGDYKDFVKELNQKLSDVVPEGLVKTVESKTEEMVVDQYKTTTSLEDMSDGSFYIDGSTLIQKTPEGVIKIEPGKKADRIKGMVRIKDAARRLFGLQNQEADTKKQLKLLNVHYNNFVKKFGAINSRANKLAIAQDPEYDFLRSLEKWDEDTQKAEKADVFTGATITKPKIPDQVNSPLDGLVLSLTQRGMVDFEYISERRGLSVESVIKELEANDYIYYDPSLERHVTKDEYLSGNVRWKLAKAQKAGLERNVEALKSVIPKDLGPEEITLRMNSPVVHEDDITTFLQNLLDSKSIRVIHLPSMGKWEVQGYAYGIKASNTYGTSRKNALEIADALLNGKTPKVYDMSPDGKQVLNQDQTNQALERAQAIKDAFNSWVWTDVDRTNRIIRKYNDEFNAVVPRKYVHPERFKNENAEVKFIGSAFPFPARKHQADAVWRLVQNPMNMLAHVVGAGKTMEMVWGAMELKRLGLRKKTMIAIPNHMVAQWTTDIYAAYPNAKVLVPKVSLESTAGRKLFMNQIATGDWDFVVVKHSQLTRIPLSKNRQELYLKGRIAQFKADLEVLQRERGKGYTQRQLEEKIDNFENRLKALESEKDEGVIPFDESGIDNLMVDEADEFKNLEYSTSLENVRGMGTKKGSQKAFDLKMKTEFIQDIGGGVTFATGTPISNTLVESYTMMRYLQPSKLDAMGISNFDEWHRLFADAVTQLELNNSGTKYVPVTRFSKIVNLPELMAVIREVWDIQTAKTLEDRGILVKGKNLPHKRVRNVSAPSTPALKSFLNFLERREASLKGKKPETGADNVLVIIGDGKKAATDMRMIHESMPDDPDSKLNIAIDNIVDIHNKYKKEKYAQAVFIEEPKSFRTTRGLDGDVVSKTPVFNALDEIKQKLRDAGIPDKEVAFIWDANTDAKKHTLFASVRSGKVRIIVGSGKKMGMGTNIQTRLKAIHHIDAPWRPRDIEQEDGRGIRQGNTVGEVEIYNYVTKGSLDAGIWNILDVKADAIQEIMSGEDTARELEENVFGSAKELAIDDPLMKESMELKNEIEKIRRAKRSYDLQTSQAKAMVKSLPKTIKNLEKDITEIEKDISKRIEKPKTFNFNGKTYGKPKEFGEAIIAWSREGIKKKAFAEKTNVGEYAGFKYDIKVTTGVRDAIEIVDDKKNIISETWVRANLVFDKKYVVGFVWSNLKKPTPAFLPQRINDVLFKGIDADLEANNTMLEMSKSDLAESEKLAAKEFKDTDVLKTKEARQREVMSQLKEREKTASPIDTKHDWEGLTGRIVDDPMTKAPPEGFTPDDEVETARESRVQASEALEFKKHRSKEPNSRQKIKSVVEVARNKNVKNKQKLLNATAKMSDIIQQNPGKNGGSGWLNAREKLYWKYKAIEKPIVKINEALERAGIKDKDAKNDIVFGIDRVRGSSEEAMSFMEEHFEPIFKENLDGVKGRESIYRQLTKYLVAKRGKWRFENDPNYQETAFTEEEADVIIDYIESDTYQHSQIVLNMAERIWDYTNKLKAIRNEGGLIDDNLMLNLREPYYVPFYRDVEKNNVKGSGGVRFTSIATHIKKMTGSKRGLRIIDPIMSIEQQTLNVIEDVNRASVMQGIVKAAIKYPDLLGGLIQKIDPKWVKVGSIEHRVQTDAVLRPKLDAFAKKIGVDKITYKAKMRKKLGVFKDYSKEIQMLYGATESVYAHEIGHALDWKYSWIRDTLSPFENELQAIADSRYEGHSTPDTKFGRYVRQLDEKVAEFISLYVSNRYFLRSLAPHAFKAFEAKLAESTIAELKDIVPSNVKHIESFEDANLVMDNSLRLDEDIVPVRIEGKIEQYRVPIEMAMSIKNLHPEQINPFVKIMFTTFHKTARMAFVTHNPSFFFPNFHVDQIDSAFNKGTIPIVDGLIGLRAVIENGELFKLYLRRGGGMNSTEAGITGRKRMTAELMYGDKFINRTRQYFDPLFWKDTGVFAGTKDLAGYLFDFAFKPITATNNAIEYATRTGATIRKWKRAGIKIKNLKEGKIDVEAKDIAYIINEGIHEGRHSTGDYNRLGYSGHVPNQIFMFANMALEGLDKFVGAWKNNSVRSAMYSSMMLMLYAGLTAWNRREEFEELYKAIPAKTKELYHIIMVGLSDLPFLKIKKSHIDKLIINPFQMVYEKITGLSHQTWKDISVSIFENMSPVNRGNLIPIPLKLFIEPMTNYNIYWEQDIEGAWIKAVQPIPWLRYNARTSEIMKTIGKAIHINPIMMQHELNTVLGGSGQHLLWTADWLFGTMNKKYKPEFDLSKATIIKRYVGKIYEWRTDAQQMIRRIDEELSNMNRAGKSPITRIKWLKKMGYTDIKDSIKAHNKYRRKLENKKRELEKAQKLMVMSIRRMNKKHGTNHVIKGVKSK